MLTSRLKYYTQLMRLDRPVGTLLLLWPTLWALWIANQGTPPISTLFLFIAGVFIMRSAGCVINDFADRNLDPYVKRTKARPLAARKISIFETLGLFLLLMTIALLIVLQFNWLTIFLACMGLIFTIIYPFLKRITHLPQVSLGFLFAWGVPMAFAACSNHMSNISWLLFVASVLWPIAYDTIYAMVDRDDDIRIGVKSTAILFGRYDTIFVNVIQNLFLCLLLLLGILLHMKVIFYICFAVAVFISFYQTYLIKDYSRETCFKAFKNNQWIGLSIFVGIMLNYI